MSWGINDRQQQSRRTRLIRYDWIPPLHHPHKPRHLNKPHRLPCPHEPLDRIITPQHARASARQPAAPTRIGRRLKCSTS